MKFIEILISCCVAVIDLLLWKQHRAGVGLVIFFLARGISLRAPMTSITSTNQRENVSLCQMNFKYSVLDFCPPSCQLAWNMSFFFLFIFPADLAEVHREKGDRQRERVNIFRTEKNKQNRNRLASSVCQSGWLAWCQALLICFTKHLNRPDNCD